MTCNKFKLTTVAALVLAATNANAALYKVVEVATPSSIVGASETFGVAIQPAAVTGTESCFTNATIGGVACDSFKLAGETRNSLEAISYREEVPFAMDAVFQYLQEFDDFKNYCNRELRYSTCESWAKTRWEDTWFKERNNLSYVNAKAFIEGGAILDTRNTVINSLDKDANPLGVKSEGTIRNNAIFTTTAKPAGSSETRAWKAITASNGTVYNVGSVSTSETITETSTPDPVFSSKAAIWDGTNTKQIDWTRGGTARQGDYYAQGSMRSIAESDTKFYGVGYNTVDGSGDLQDMNASVFISKSLDLADSANTWTTKSIEGAKVNSNSSNDYKYSNSVATDINKNLFVIGNSKRNGRVPENGSAGSKMFVVTDASVATPTATYLTGGIFFAGSSGEARAVNNFNEIVGQVDAETTREVDGSERRHRGFIYPYQATGTDPSRIDLFQNKAWFLDDLTNDGNVSGENNKFRIIDASGINDAGVISATAIKCMIDTNGDGRGNDERAYDTTSHNSYCAGAASNAVEEVVAVKLIPIEGKGKSDIQARSTDTAKVDRKGGSLGWFALTVLGLLGFRRKFK
ncbi:MULTISPECIES: DUF3466 family protein [Vibrio]|uniref:DUF3466 family protein n=2 Tax=Vibrio TaxID=662 RepID=A0A2N7NHN3_9VIBR|nr:DUF3466 family protein [Vibrio tasmaniensis]PMP13963.1 GlyGly-CTERM sorting domain-containing protein [Vibrio tasmaniensis]TKG32179.1 DUF3466 family protein [Vibrio tasmaniensis]TKG39617.1 DUF3466 family protein [Vibrio tasmaniensis]TKG40711.1 DUF3466 family protein [Vibrio tasmaniensis]TKG49947.1 DUF3466 family protein [Vibrio tasmaniensis]